jgi:hypothetical protein
MPSCLAWSSVRQSRQHGCLLDLTIQRVIRRQGRFMSQVVEVLDVFKSRYLTGAKV